MKLTKEQQEKTERIFQLHHAYFLLDGTKNLELPDLIRDKIRMAQLDLAEEQNLIRMELVDES